MFSYQLPVQTDDCMLSVAETEGPSIPRAVILIVHGMAEHKGRYYPFMEKMASEGYHMVVFDQRGHGNTAVSSESYGYFDENGSENLVNDLYSCILFLRKKYPAHPLFVFAHSMGTIITRAFLKLNDHLIDGVILSGIPTETPMAVQGLHLAKFIAKIKSPYYRSRKLNHLVLGIFNRGYDTPNSWLTRDMESVRRFNQDTKCGFVFTANGFIALFTLLLSIFEKEKWMVKNPALPILVMAGMDDPVIQSKEKFIDAVAFLRQRGYNNLSSKLYPNMRHELLQEMENDVVYQDILSWLDKNLSPNI